MNEPNGAVIIAYWLMCVAVITSAFAFFVLGPSTGPTKRRVFRWYMGVAGILVTGWFTMLGGVLGFLAAIVLFSITAPICWHTTRFCDACGATMFNQFIRAKFCPRCGADLDAQEIKPPTDEPAS